MSKWTLLLGVIAATVILYKVHIKEVTFVDVVKYVVVNRENGKAADSQNSSSLPAMAKSHSRLSAGKNAAMNLVQKPKSLSIMAFGDVMLGRYVRVLMDENGLNYPFEKIPNPAGLFTEDANVVFGNLEGPIDGQGKKGGTSMMFSFNEDIGALLKNYGFTLLSIANNHAQDQGQTGRENTIKTLEKNDLGWCGNANEADSNSVHYGTVGRENYAFICLHSAIRKLDLEAALELIKSVRKNVNYLIVSIHWGIEYQHKANYELQIEPARAFIDAGADLIIGHHPHVVQNFEVYNGKLILYSLGNFVFDQYWSGDTQEELAVGLVLDHEGENLRTKFYLFPMKSEKSQSRMMTEEERAKWIPKFIGYGNYGEKLQEQIKNGVIEIP